MKTLILLVDAVRRALGTLTKYSKRYGTLSTTDSIEIDTNQSTATISAKSVSTSNIDINIVPLGTGVVKISGTSIADLITQEALSVTNATGGTLAAGTLVSTVVNADGSIGVVKADANAGILAQYVVETAILNGAVGTVYNEKEVTGLNTSTAVAVGSPVYLSATAGTYAFDTPPANANDLVQVVGYVKTKAVSGSIFFVEPRLVKVGTNEIEDSAVTAAKIGATFPFTGTPDTISPTAALDGAPVFTGTPDTISPTAALFAAPVFTGTPDTISPTAALAGAPVFTGTPDTISPTAALAGAPVFTGTPDTISPTAALDNAPAFTGDALAGHSHTTSGSVNTYQNEQWKDIAGSINTDNETVDGATNEGDLDVAAEAAVAAGAWTHGALTNPGHPARVVCITIHNDTIGALNLYEGTMTFTVTGTGFDGTGVIDLITFTSSAGNKSVATLQYRHKYGVKAFATVTDITLDNVPDNDLKIGAGIGSKIRIYNTLATLAEADVLRASINGTNYSIGSKVDTTNGTINWDTLTDSDDIQVMIAAESLTAGSSSSDSAGTPSGSNDAPSITVTGASYTPAGTNDTPTITVTGASYTPAGTNDAPSITVTGAAYTPAGTNDAPTITVTGAAYTPAGTNDAPAITVTGAAYTPAGTVTPT